MVSAMTALSSFIVTYIINGTEQKITINLVHGNSWVKLEHDSFLAIEWFENNNMKLNQHKCHLLASGY